MLFLSAFFERPLTEEVQAAYSIALEDLAPEQLALAFSRASRESKFWPSPAVLRELAGIETPDQSSERQAREDLEWLLWFLRRHGIEGRPRHGACLQEAGRDGTGEWQPALYELIPAPPIPERVRNTVAELGAGDGKVGVQLIASHPLLSKDLDEYPTLGLKLSAIEKLEARWIAAWKKANRAAGSQ